MRIKSNIKPLRRLWQSGAALVIAAVPHMAAGQVSIDPAPRQDQPAAQTARQQSDSAVPTSDANIPPAPKGKGAKGLGPNLHRGPRLGSHFVLKQNDFPLEPFTERAGVTLPAGKRLPLNADGSAYVSLGAELRTRPLIEDIPSLGLPAQPTQINVQFRERFSADVHLSDNVRVYTELVMGQAITRNFVGRAATRQKNGPEMDQYFVEFRDDMLGGQTGVVLGKQALFFGSGVIFGLGNAQNFMRTFTGVRAYYKNDRFRGDIIAVRPTQWRDGVFNDGLDTGSSVVGAYTVTALKRSQSMALNLDLFGFDVHSQESRVLRVPAPENRVTFGTRMWGTFGKLQFDFNVLGQRGKIGNVPIRAWGSQAVFRLPIRNAPLRGAVIARYEIRSGGSRDGNVVRTYSALYPSQLHPTFGTYLGNANYYSGALAYGMKPARDLQVNLEARSFWRYSLKDGYNQTYGSTVVNRGTDERFIGFLPSINARWIATRDLTLSAYYGRLFSGKGHRQLGQRDLDSVILMASFMF